MDFSYDSFVTPSGYHNNPFGPSVLSYTLSELDNIDTSIHKLFDGLPEIFEDHASSTSTRDVDAVLDAVVPAVRDAVDVVVPSPVLPATPPAHGSRPSSMCSTEDREWGLQPVSVPVEADHHREVRLAQKGKGVVGRGKGDSKSFQTPTAVQSSGPKKPVLLEAKPVLVPPVVACMVPKFTLPAVDLSSVKVNEHVDALAYPPSLGLGSQLCFRAPKRKVDASQMMRNTRTQKTRYFDKVEHIVRERWRRDDMAGKFLALESLLPPSSKRDRSTIVEDSMKLVKSLQHRKDEALKRRAELKQAVASAATHSPPGGLKVSRIIEKIGSLAVKIPHRQATESRGKRPRLEVDVHTYDDSSTVQLVVPKFLSDCVQRFYVHSELSTGDIVIEMICDQIPNFHSALLKSMESLDLEVIRCSVTRTINKLMCNITVKPFPSSASVSSSSTSIMEDLSWAFRKE